MGRGFLRMDARVVAEDWPIYLAFLLFGRFSPFRQHFFQPDFNLSESLFISSGAQIYTSEDASGSSAESFLMALALTWDTIV
jgi:hypothetical protein